MKTKKNSKVILNLSYYKKKKLKEICEKNNINFEEVFEAFVDRFIKETTESSVNEKVFENKKNRFNKEELVKKINRWAHSKSSISHNMIKAFLIRSFNNSESITVNSFFEAYNRFDKKVDKNTFISRLKQMCSNSLSARGKIFIRCGDSVSLNPVVEKEIMSLYEKGCFQEDSDYLE